MPPTAPATALPPPSPPPAPPPPPRIANPVPRPEGGAPPADADAFAKHALDELFGRKGARGFLRLDGVIHRFVATVNNLATDDAPADLWPVNRTPGAFQTEARDGATVIAASNAARYQPFVRFATAFDTKRAVALYTRLYPLLQRGYEELGFPGKYLNDRVVQVIDDLLATPKVTGPLRVQRVEPDGGGTVLYLFADAGLESASAGQKILLRMGPENAAPLMAKLAEIRQLIAAAPHH